MDIGLFLPVATNGNLASTTAPPFEPSFPALLDVVRNAENYGIDFALAQSKLRGFGGASHFWDACMDSFTLSAGLIASTSRIKLYATAPVLALPPAMAARAASTIDSIDPGRFGVNIVTGWQKAEYDSIGLWPGETHYARRYDFAAEYITILKMLWDTGHCSFDGEFFHYKDARLLPTPAGKIEFVCAGLSDLGLKFTARHGDYAFLPLSGINNPRSIDPLLARVESAGDAVGRRCGSYPLAIVCAAETRSEAEDRWAFYTQGIDLEALGWASEQAALDKAAATAASATARNIIGGTDVAMSLGALIGSHAEIAEMLDEIAATPGVSGIMLALDDWRGGLDALGQHILPRMRSRRVDRRRLTGEA